MTLFGEISGLRTLYLALHSHCSVFLILLSTLAFVNLICNQSSNFISLLQALLSCSLLKERHFYPPRPPASISHPTPTQVPLGPASRPALSGLFFPHRYYHFHPVSVHQGTAMGLVPIALSIPLSCSLGVSFSEPPQDLSLDPQGNPGASPAHDPTVYLQTLRQREEMRLSAEDGHCSYVLSYFRVCKSTVAFQLDFWLCGAVVLV